VISSLFGAFLSYFKTQRELALENLALRHQIGVLKRALGTKRVYFKPPDRKLWVVLSHLWSGWQQVLAIVQPATVIRWRRDGFRRYWMRKSRRRDGRPELDREVRALIRKMSMSNPTWGAPRIRNELVKIGINVSRSTVAKYMVRHRKPPSPTWRSFLDNHVKDLISLDFFVVPTATFRAPFVLLLLEHDHRYVRKAA
jgi:putative transposase